MLETKTKRITAGIGEAGWLLSSLRAAQSSRPGVELAAVRGDPFARCALSLLPPSLFVIHFYAEWNGYDRQLEVSLRELAYLSNWLSYRCDIDQEGDLASALEVESVPTLIAFDRGREVGRMVGWEGAEAFVLVHRAELFERRSAPDERAG